MYHPDENNYFDDKLSVYIEKVKVPTQDGLDLLGWYHEKAVSYTHLTLPTNREV